MVDFIKRDKDDIYAKPILGFLFKNQKFIMTLKIVVAFIFFYAIYFGFTHQGKDNTFTWAVFWGIFWSLFMVVTLPTLGRVFCGICPHGFLGKYITKFGLKKKMPKWMQNQYIGVFILVIGWWGIYYMFPGIYRTPFGTAMMFLVMTILAFIIYFIYRDMSYCKYICPIGTLTRAYAKLSFTWLGSYKSACNECKTFECATACQHNLKPFTFDGRNSMTDCTLCMDCSAACEAISFKVKKPSFSLFSKFQILKAEVWTFILILAAIPISMAFHHGLGRSKVASDMIWAKTAEYFKGFIDFGSVDAVGLFAFLYAMLFTIIAATLGMYIASKILQKDYKKTFYDLGYSYAPLFILGSIAHSLESFFTRGYDRIIEGFAFGFGFGKVDIASLASRGDKWLAVFGILKWIAIIWALIILYKRMKLIDSTKLRKTLAFPFAALLVIFFLGVNSYRSYILDTYGRASRGTHGSHSSHAMKSTDSNHSKNINILSKSTKPLDTVYFSDKKPTPVSRMGHSGAHMMGTRDRSKVPSKKVWLVTDPLDDTKCVHNTIGKFFATDIDNNLVEVKLNQKSCTSISFKMPKSGYYKVYYLLETPHSINVAKYEYKRFDHSAEAIYEKEKMSAKTIQEIPFDILQLRAEDETFYSRPHSGDVLKFKVIKNGVAQSGVNISLTTQFGWQKNLKTDANGIAKIQLIQDYLPKWNKFNKRFKENFLVVATYTEDSKKYKASFSGIFTPPREAYSSYSYGFVITLIIIILLSGAIYLYRYRLQKPFKEVHFDD